MTRYTRRAFVAAVAATVPACRRTPAPPAYVPASGTITLSDNTPITDAKLLFWPQDESGASFPTIPYSLSDKEGKFAVMMGADKPGVPPGRYKVTVTLPPQQASKFKLPTSHSDPAATPLEVVVPASGSTSLTIRVER